MKKTIKKKLEDLANEILQDFETRPYFSNRDFMNCVIILQHGLTDKMFQMQQSEGLNLEESSKMAESCGRELRKLIHTYTGLDTHKVDEFLK